MQKAQASAIPLLDIYQREMKAYMHTMTCTGMFNAVVFIITPNWKQPQMSINWKTDKNITVDPFHETLPGNKKGRNYIHSKTTWVNYELLGWVKAASLKGLHVIWFHSQHSGQGKSIVTDSILVIAWSWGTEGRINCKGTGEKLGAMEIFWILIVVVVSWEYTSVKTPHIVHFQRVKLIVLNYTLLKLYSNVFKMQ